MSHSEPESEPQEQLQQISVQLTGSGSLTGRLRMFCDWQAVCVMVLHSGHGALCGTSRVSSQGRALCYLHSDWQLLLFRHWQPEPEA
jgi:hypothetical protein